MDLKGTQEEIWNNPWSWGYKVIPPTRTGVGLVRAPSGMHPVHHGRMWNGQCKALLTVRSGEMGMCHCVHLFPEHLGTLHISDLFFTSEDKFHCNWKIICFCMISTEYIISSVLRVSQTASTFKWGLTGAAYLHKEIIFLLYRHSGLFYGLTFYLVRRSSSLLPPAGIWFYEVLLIVWKSFPASLSVAYKTWLILFFIFPGER